MKNLVHVSILICIVFWLGGCDQKPAIEPSGKTIKVGIIAPLSGPEHTYGEEGIKGLEIAMLLQPYLQNGDRIELVEENDKDDPALTVKLLNKLVEEVKVSAIITFSSTSPVLAMAKLVSFISCSRVNMHLLYQFHMLCQALSHSHYSYSHHFRHL